MPDWAFPLVLIAAIALAGVAWVAQGMPGFSRIDRGGGSILLGKPLQCMVYWAIQPIAARLICLGISANAITWSSLAVGILAGIALADGRFGLAAFVGAIAFLADALDGLVARSTHTASAAGEVLDAAIDRHVEFAWFAGLAFYFHATPWCLGLVLLALQGGWMVSYASAKAEAMQVEVPRGAMRRVERCVYLTGGAALASFAPLMPTGQLPPAWPVLAVLTLIGVVGNVSAARRLAALCRSVRGR